MELKAKERDFTPVSDEPEADLRELAAAALRNAGIDTEEQLRAAREAASDAPVDVHQPTVVKANKDKIVYEITFDLPNAGDSRRKASPNSRHLSAMTMIGTIQ